MYRLAYSGSAAVFDSYDGSTVETLTKVVVVWSPVFNFFSEIE
jgi:hypothetical protein